MTSNPEIIEKQSIYPHVTSHKAAKAYPEQSSSSSGAAGGEVKGEWKKRLEEDSAATTRTSMTGSSDDDIIRLLWDSFRPDTHDELAVRDMLDILRVFGITEDGPANDAVVDIAKRIGRSRVNYGQFLHWWRDHGRKRVPAHTHSIYGFFDQLRHFYNKQIGSGSPVTVESLSQFLLGFDTHTSKTHSKSECHATATKVFHAMHWPLTLQLPFIDLLDALICNKKLIRMLVPALET